MAEGRGGGGALAPGSTCAPFIFASSPLFSRALSLGPGLARAGPEQKDQRAHFQPKHVLRDRRIDFQKCEFVYAHARVTTYIYIYIYTHITCPAHPPNRVPCGEAPPQARVGWGRGALARTRPGAPAWAGPWPSLEVFKSMKIFKIFKAVRSSKIF